MIYLSQIYLKTDNKPNQNLIQKINTKWTKVNELMSLA